MTKRLLKSGLEVLADLKNFFESSIDFLSLSVGKMRKEHGPAFNISTIKALLNLRTDLTKSEKAQVISDSRIVLKDYQDDKVSKNNGIFNQIDTEEAAKDFNDDMVDSSKGVPEYIDDPADEVSEEFDMEAFMREGGINADELDDKDDDACKKAIELAKAKEEKKIVGREDMSGWLMKSKESLKEK